MIEIIPNWHPIFVHFSVALLTISFGLFVLGMFAKCEQAILVAKWNLWIGSGITLLTVAAGMYAYNTVSHDTPSHLAMTEHKNIALFTVALLLPLVIWSVISHRKKHALSAGFVGLFLLVAAMLMGTAWHGGELVYRYGLGVMSMPKTDTHDHDHGNSHSGIVEHNDHVSDIDSDMDFGGLDDFDEPPAATHTDHTESHRH